MIADRDKGYGTSSEEKKKARADISAHQFSGEPTPGKKARSSKSSQR